VVERVLLGDELVKLALHALLLGPRGGGQLLLQLATALFQLLLACLERLVDVLVCGALLWRISYKLKRCLKKEYCKNVDVYQV